MALVHFFHIHKRSESNNGRSTMKLACGRYVGRTCTSFDSRDQQQARERRKPHQQHSMAPQSPSIASAAKQTSTPSVNTKELRVIKDSQCRNDNYKERPSTLQIVMASGAKTSRRKEKTVEFKADSIPTNANHAKHPASAS